VTHRIVWRQAAQDDLDNLYDWIADQAGNETAYNYTSRIKAHVDKLADLPGWGAPREELGPGVRTIAYRRRTVIAYLASGESVEILSIFHGGRAVVGSFDE
jgi:toxin ParE1/3/4